MKLRVLIAFVIIVAFFSGCSKSKDENPEPGITTTAPKINSLTADKYELKVGGEEPATITCEATGGNLEYTWEVDLGDIFPLNSTGSVVRFTGSDCCLGEKIIKCTVKNDKGSDTKTVSLNIFIP